jgi:predicted nuclease of predicted toxin-antitoxin system
VRLLLDEMSSPKIAVQLRRRGRDVIAVTEPEHEARYGGVDAVVRERAQEDARAVVTENVADFERARVSLSAPGEIIVG